MAKASGQSAAVICTSGTAIANYYPAVLEAESSRVPLIVLTGDRTAAPARSRRAANLRPAERYGSHVRAFRQMPLPTGESAALAFARQAAREACAAAGREAAPFAGESRAAGACLGGPVHLNFPFDEPLKPNLQAEGLFENRTRAPTCCPILRAVSLPAYLDPVDARRVLDCCASAACRACRRGLVATLNEANALLAWSDAFGYPVLPTRCRACAA